MIQILLIIVSISTNSIAQSQESIDKKWEIFDYFIELRSAEHSNIFFSFEILKWDSLEKKTDLSTLEVARKSFLEEQNLTLSNFKEFSECELFRDVMRPPGPEIKISENCRKYMGAYFFRYSQVIKHNEDYLIFEQQIENSSNIITRYKLSIFDGAVSIIESEIVYASYS